MSTSNSSSANAANKMPIWDLEVPQLDEWIRNNRSLFPVHSTEPAKHQFVPLLWKNLENALQEMKTEPVRSTEEHKETSNSNNSNNNNPPARKKAKKEKLLGFKLHDPYKVWIHVKEFETVQDDMTSTTTADTNGNNGSSASATSHIMLPEALPNTLGARLAELSVAGILNGFVGVLGGVVDRQLKPLRGVAVSEIQTTAGPCPMAKVKMWALALHQSVQTRLERDVLNTTPQRIADMLCPDLTPAEFKAIRRRVYDTVILGKGLKVEDTSDEIPVATNAQSVHDIEKFKKCKVCGENDQSAFILDRKNGDVICSTCGTVHSESIMHEGSQFRKFEGEVDRNHHGDAGNPLLSSSYNMSTTLGGVQATSGAGMGGFGSNQNKRGLETILRNAHAYTELNVNSFGNSKDSQGRTRTGYKDKQKRQAFVQMNHVGDALNLHEAMVQRAKEIFAGFRDDRELLHQLKGVIAACLCEAFDQLTQDGRKILQQQETGTVAADELKAKGSEAQSEDAAKKAAVAKTISTNRRAAKRAELHKASMAGKGGLFLDFSEVQSKVKGEDTSGGAAAASPTTCSRFETMPVPTWDLEDCRSWLLEASRSIAQSWVDERDALPGGDGNTGSKGNGSSIPTAKKNFPKGSRAEIEGKLVENSITLCEFLEGQINKITSATAGAASKRVITPRVQDMSKLGIRWQHAHERGSGGKGGVGNSGNFKKRAAAAAASSRRAGQILILQSATKLGDILKDPLAGESFHRELRALVGRQKTRSDKELRDEATRQRLMQMKRKPWLQAKVTGDVK